MNKHKIALIVCFAWFVVEPMFMFAETLNSEVGIRRLNKLTNLYMEALKVSESASSNQEKGDDDSSSLSINNSKGDRQKTCSILSNLYQARNELVSETKSVFGFWQIPYVNAFSFCQRTLGKRYVKGLFRTTNDSLVPCETEIDSDLGVSELEEKVKRFKKCLDQKGVKFLYVQHPSKSCKYIAQQCPFGSIGMDSSEHKADKFINFCKRENIDFIDLREELYKTGNSWDDAFYKTDHHWKAETGFWAFQIVAEKLKEKYGFYFDDTLVDTSSYNCIPNYQNNLSLGSKGKYVGRYFTCSLDSITKISPKFDSNYSIVFLTGNLDDAVDRLPVKGSFDEVCLYERCLVKKPITSYKLYSMDSYSFYNDGNMSRYVLNLNAPNDKKILLVRDSYSGVFSLFLYGTCKEFYEIDLRNYHSESLLDCISRVKPDIVIIMANYMFEPNFSFEEKVTLKFE